jgi:acid phosphatase (class A)
MTKVLLQTLKKYHNRKRPYELDSSLKAIVLKSMQTPSYPSGHSVQGTGIAKLLADKYPKAKSAFLKTGKNISYSRRVARAHYKSDSKMGEELGNSMYKFIKSKK